MKMGACIRVHQCLCILRCSHTVYFFAFGAFRLALVLCEWSSSNHGYFISTFLGTEL